MSIWAQKIGRRKNNIKCKSIGEHNRKVIELIEIQNECVSCACTIYILLCEIVEIVKEKNKNKKKKKEKCEDELKKYFSFSPKFPRDLKLLSFASIKIPKSQQFFLV